MKSVKKTPKEEQPNIQKQIEKLLESKKFGVVFPVNPQTAIRMTQGQVKMLKIPDYKIRDPKKLAKKKRIEQYLRYKEQLANLAAASKFILPEADTHIVFYLETDKKVRWGTAHKQRPDRDNLLKAIQDALCVEDGHIWDARETKVWCRPGEGRIEIWV